MTPKRLKEIGALAYKEGRGGLTGVEVDELIAEVSRLQIAITAAQAQLRAYNEDIALQILNDVRLTPTGEVK